MAETNNERVGKGLALFTDGVGPFVDRELRQQYGDSWESVIDVKGPVAKGDAHFLLTVMIREYRLVFFRTLGHAGRNLIGELLDVRNNWAHQEAFTSDDTYRALDTIERLLQSVSAGDQAAEIARIKNDVQRRRYTEEARRVTRRKTAEPLEGMPSGNLKPWREIVTPHRDVASGDYQQAEFAADLHQVWRGEAEEEYGNPEEFFRRTFITDGLGELLRNASKRLRGEGGDPIVQLQTNFGGGKTHSLIALYHLAGGTDPSKLAGVDELLAGTNSQAPPKANRAVLVGQMITPGAASEKADGVSVNTLWGELAWQLGGAEGYEVVRQADEARVSPGAALITLLKQHSPCLILIDEWVAYARQLYGREDQLPGGSFDTQMTFAQALSDAAKSVKNAMLVVSIPASDIEVGGEAGKEALTRLSNVIFRQEASWKPASSEEGFEIVRRRLFEEVPADLARERDAVVDAFGDFYQKNKAEFPSAAQEGSYRKRMAAAYPIHPELFDKLFNEWSTLEKFQRTRGVLRLMAAVIHELWERGDTSLMIMPAFVPIDSPPVIAELTRYLQDGWTPVIAADVDGENALPMRIDRDNPNFGRFSATRRVARTIYIGSAPTVDQTNKGIDDRSIKLGCVQPGESPQTFGDALSRLANQATYLIQDNSQYWYSLGATISRTASDRAESLFLEEHADEEIRRRMMTIKDRGEFSAVHWAPRDHTEVPDEPEARLVVLGPSSPHASGSANTPALEAAASILSERAGGPRINRNALVFVAADTARLDELRKAARQYLAWKSIWDEQAELNLDELSRRQAENQSARFDQTVTQRISEAFRWILIPGQESGSAEVTWEKVQAKSTESIPVRTSAKLKAAELLITTFGGVPLRMELDKIPLWQGDSISTGQLRSYFAQYLYLPRLSGPSVLAAAIEDGVAMITWGQDTFAYADGFDEPSGKYEGLVGGRPVDVEFGDRPLVVKPDVAARQLEEAAPSDGDAASGDGDGGAVSGGGAPGATTGDAQGGEPPHEVGPVAVRFYGVKSLDPQRVSRDASQIADEIVQHLVGLIGADVEIKIEISADVPGGVPSDTVRTVTENASTLKFEQHGFEES